MRGVWIASHPLSPRDTGTVFQFSWIEAKMPVHGQVAKRGEFAPEHHWRHDVPAGIGVWDSGISNARDHRRIPWAS